MTAQGNRGLVFPMRAELEYNFEATTSSQLDLILRQQVSRFCSATQGADPRPTQDRVPIEQRFESLFGHNIELSRPADLRDAATLLIGHQAPLPFGG